MYTSIKDFLADWQYEVAATGKVLAALTNESLGQRVSDNGRTLGRLAWHITQTLTEMPHRAGLLDADALKGTPDPMHAADIRPEYDRRAQEVANAIEARWTDDVLRDKLPMYGEEWMKGTILSVLLLHQAHHRGQMTVLMRQAGLRVPGVYGPAHEEWATYGMPAEA